MKGIGGQGVGSQVREEIHADLSRSLHPAPHLSGVLLTDYKLRERQTEALMVHMVAPLRIRHIITKTDLARK